MADIPSKPITRKETYLAAIAGQDVKVPDYPITREEAYLAEIAKNGTGGGGTYAILGSYDTVEELEAAHPTGKAGDAYLVGDPSHVYVWLVDDEEWQDGGEFAAIEGPEGPEGPAGADGKDGTDGKDGKDGTDGAPGQDGIGIKNVAVNTSNHLIVTKDDDTTEDAGEIDVSVPIDDTNPAPDKVFSSEKIMSEVFQYERDVTTRYLKVDPDIAVSNISSTEDVYLFDNENVAYISDIAETTNKSVTYKVKDGLIYMNGTASGGFYISVDVKIPSSWAGSAVIGTLEIVSGSVTGANIKLRLPCTYMSGSTEKQMALMQGTYGSLQMISVTQTAPDIQIQSGAACSNLVLRPYFALRNDANKDTSITPRPTAMRTVVSGTIAGKTGTLMTMNGADFTAHVTSRNPLSVLFGKRMALCGTSIAYGHSGDSFGYTIGENENMTFDKFAWGTARMASSSPVISIVDQVASMTKGYDYILVEGGINDALNGVTLGSLTEGFDATLDTSTAMGALETICKTLVQNYPSAKKLFILCHKCTNASCVPYAVQDTFFEAMITALVKWNIPYIDIRKFPLCAYTVAIGQQFFGSDFGNGGSLHPNHAGYALGYVDQITAKMKEI